MAFAALTIDITAKLANLEAGLKRTEQQLAGFASKAEAAAAGVAAAFGAIAGSVAVGSLVNAFSAAIEELASLDDAAEATGASVEELSSILNTLAPTGVGLEQITDAASKLAKAMREAQDQSSAQSKAFAALGVETRNADGSFRSTGAVLDDVAKSLARYEDGTNKTILAQILFGKSGAALLSMLKDLATRVRELPTATAETTAEAERLSNAWRALRRDGELFAQSIASAVIPALADAIERFREARKESLGFFRSLQSTIVGETPDAVRDVLGNQVANLAKLRELESKLLANLDKGSSYDKSNASRRLPGVREDIVETERFVTNLLKQYDQLGLAQRRLEGSALTAYLKGETYGPKPDAPVIDESSDKKGGAKGLDDAVRARKELDELIAKSVAEDQLREEAEAAKAFADVTKQLVGDFERFEAIEMTSKTAALGTGLKFFERVAAIMGELPSKVRANAEALTTYFDNRFFDGLISEEDWQAAIDRVNGITTQVKGDTEKLNDAARELGLTFRSAFEDAIVGGKSFGDVLKGLADDLTRLIIRKSITEPLATMASNAIGPLFGGARADGGPMSAGMAYLVGERGPELVVPRQSGTVVPNRALGGSVTIINNIDSRADRSAISADIQRSQLASLAMLQDMRARGKVSA